jgi:hypothetical protein
MPIDRRENLFRHPSQLFVRLFANRTPFTDKEIYNEYNSIRMVAAVPLDHPANMDHEHAGEY